jgi:hypothetical protein
VDLQRLRIVQALSAPASTARAAAAKAATAAAAALAVFAAAAGADAGEAGRSREDGPGASRRVEFLHIEANAGGSSGGHAALCFPADDACFHFQHSHGGLIGLTREHPVQVEHGYRVIGNRTIHALELALNASEYDALLSAFENRYRLEESQTELLIELEKDVAFLDLVAAASRRRDAGGADAAADTSALRIPGTGYFTATEGRHAASLNEASFRDVSGDVSEAGAGAGTERVDRERLGRLAASTDSEIDRLALKPSTPLPAATGSAPAPLWHGPARAYRERIAARAAIAVLRGQLQPRDDMLRTPRRAAPLRDEERAALERWAQRLEAASARLVGSADRGQGYAALIALARLHAVRASLSSGRLVVLDVFSESAPTISADVVRAETQAVQMLRDERYLDLERERAAFFSADESSELLWSRLETTAALAADLDAAATHGVALRMPPDRPLPSASARRADLPLPFAPPADATAARDRARQRLARYRASLVAARGYDLIRRNCVTELAKVMHEAMEKAPRPGARTATAGSLDFVPFVSAASLRRSGRVLSERELPSWRRLQLEAMHAREPALHVALRETVVPAARSYNAHHDDPVFALFTDRAPALRPVFGAVNIATGFVNASVGTLSAPLDGGRRMRRGLSGVLFSLPELGFVSLRKGTYPLAPLGWLPGVGD